MLFAVIAAFLVPLIASAQPTIRKSYLDSLQASGATVAAFHTRGYGNYKNLRTDVAAYKDKALAIKFTKVMDSATIYGGWVTFGQDTTWTQLRVKPLELQGATGLYTAGAVVVPQSARDTSVVWITPVTTDKMVFTVPLDGFYFEVYRVGMGKADSGKTFIRDIRRGGY